MTVTADPITHKRLVLVKQLYNQAVTQSAEPHNSVTRIMAVIGLDLAVETVLKAVVGTFDPSNKDERNFPSLLKQADDLLTAAGLSQVPDKRNILRVHDIRNDAQHRAKYPNEAEINDCRTYVRDFLEKLLHQVWDLSIHKISLTDLIQNDIVRGFLSKAEAALVQSSYSDAVFSAVAGLTRAKDLVRRTLLGGSRASTKALIVERSGRQVADRDLLQAFEKTQEGLIYVALGLNYVDYLRFEKLIRRLRLTVRVYDDGTYRSDREIFVNGTGPLDLVTADDAERLITYCIDTVIQIESRMGSLAKPLE